MKRLVLALALLFCHHIYAQTSGTITFEAITNLHKGLINPTPKFKASMPEFRTTKNILMFNEKKVVYKDLDENLSGETVTKNAEGTGFTKRVGPPPAYVFTNLKAKEMIQRRGISGEIYLLKDTYENFNWTITDETKTILGYVCKKATGKNDRNHDLVAWFTESIKVPSGPAWYNGLPGMILEVDVDNGFVVYKAVEFDNNFDEKKLKAPQDGITVNRKKYNNLMAENQKQQEQLRKAIMGQSNK
jgi:GLPGLI family protein